MAEFPADAPTHVKLRWWRMEVAKLTTKELADLVGYPQVKVVRLEAGDQAFTARDYEAYRAAIAWLPALPALPEA